MPTRMQAIADLWVPSPDVVFVDALGVFKSHEAISGMVDKIQGMGGDGDEFIALGRLGPLNGNARIVDSCSCCR
jgi:hypothetical protein